MARGLLLSVLLAGQAHAGGHSVLGAWSGTGIQGPQTWAMQVQIVPGGARVDYPDIPCGGVWLLETGVTPAEGTEWLTYGHDLCLDGLTVTAVPQGGELMIRWFDASGAEIAYAPLTAVGSGGKAGKSGSKN